MPTETQVRIGSRGSDLALWQSNYVADLLRKAYRGISVEVEVYSTKGDKVLDTPLPLIGGKGLFTAELEAALNSGEIDLAVHSLKDLPTENPDGLTVGAIPPRAPVADVMVSREHHTLNSLPPGAVIGTSSLRRAAQLWAYRSDLSTTDIRGNVPTRVEKAHKNDGLYDAIVLAQAGLIRLDMAGVIDETLPLEIMMPAPGQGALGIQCRNDEKSLELLAPVDDLPTRLAVTAERAFLAGLGGGCSVPIAAYASVNGSLACRGRVCALDGSRQIDVGGSTEHLTVEAAVELGRKLAEEALEQGASHLLEGLDD